MNVCLRWQIESTLDELAKNVDDVVVERYQ